jgi:carbohydrate-selective porin OprB
MLFIIFGKRIQRLVSAGLACRRASRHMVEREVCLGQLDGLLRETLEDRGVNFTGNWKGTFYRIFDGRIRQRGAFDEELHFHLKLDVEKMLDLTGLSASLS